MDFYEIFVRSPVNGSAAKMMSFADGVEKDIDRDELAFLLRRLHRKRRLLNKAIGVDTNAKRKNLTYKLNQAKNTYRQALNPRGVDEWRRNGQSIRRLNNELESRGKELEVEQ